MRPCVVAVMVTAVDLSCSSLQLTLKCHCNDFSMGCLISISPQQRLGIAGEPPSSPQTGPTMGSCSSARRTPTTVAHDAPQLSVRVSDRAPHVQMSMDYIKQYHATGISWHTTLNNHASIRRILRAVAQAARPGISRVSRALWLASRTPSLHPSLTAGLVASWVRVLRASSFSAWLFEPQSPSRGARIGCVSIACVASGGGSGGEAILT